MLKTRLVTAAIGLPVLIVLMLVGGWVWTLAVAAVLCLAAVEYLRSVEMERPGIAIGLVLVAALAITAALDVEWRHAALVIAVVAPGLWPVFAKRTSTALRDWSLIALGAVYYGWLGSHAIVVRDLPDGREWLFLVVFTIFATDSGAYLIGRSIGRHRLAPSISPRKTWEGAIAGWICGAAAAVAIGAIADLPVTRIELIAIALVLPIVGQMGDLAKSGIKRQLGIKDFGAILPGHGGMADRIDSLLFAMPVLFTALLWMLPA